MYTMYTKLNIFIIVFTNIKNKWQQKLDFILHFFNYEWCIIAFYYKNIIIN